MKKLLLALILLLISFSSHAQKIYFTDTTNVWIGVFWNSGGPSGGTTSSFFGLSYQGDTIIKSQPYHLLNNAGAIREDTVAGKVYIRFTRYGDTLEHVLYDYSLKVHDTLRLDNGSFHFTIAVQSIDSTLVLGRYYKAWTCFARRVDSSLLSGGSSGWIPFGTVVDGIGNTDNPLWPIYWAEFEAGYQVQCFHDRYGTPPLTPAIPTGSGGPVLIGPPLAYLFDNSSSCALAVSDVSTTKNIATIYPNPGGNDLQLKLASTLKDARLTIYNSCGKKVISMDASNKTSIAIGGLLHVPGLYFFQLKDAQTMKVQSGKFIFQ